MPPDVTPYPKASQLARGERRYRRKIASPKQWQAIQAAKLGPCRVCGEQANNGIVHGLIQLHHLVPRDLGGDDVADNIVPLCPSCHDHITNRSHTTALILCSSLTDAEYTYAVGKLGEDVWTRAYGIEYTR